jgi:hypothetical protein
MPGALLVATEIGKSLDAVLEVAGADTVVRVVGGIVVVTEGDDFSVR